MTVVRQWQLHSSVYKTGHWNKGRRKWGCAARVWYYFH